MNYEVEIVKLLIDNPELKNDYQSICAVAQLVAKNEEDYLSYVWAYASGKSDWKELAKQLL
jgi:hypothetical protein